MLVFFKKIINNIRHHPKTLWFAKFVFSNKLVANNSIYKRLVNKKVRLVSQKNSEYKDTICIETALTCNSRCVFCGHHNKPMAGIMSTDLFRKIIDECYDYGIKNVTLGIYGEVMVDKNLLDKIGYIRKQGLTYNIITNASLLTSQITDELIRLGGLANISFSVNGFSKEVYEETMVGLNRDVTYSNVLYFLEQKEKFKADNIKVTITAVETKINKDDFKEFYQFWKKQKGVNSVLSGELIDRMGIEYRGEVGELGPMTKKTNWLLPCRQLWGPLNVYYDGKVSPCCVDNDKRELIIGDCNKQTIREISTGKELNNLRQCHLGEKRRQHPICGQCYLNSIWLGQ
jgi:MoaA/NifB/PqqE/SkfB family radical SAM enzyme